MVKSWLYDVLLNGEEMLFSWHDVSKTKEFCPKKVMILGDCDFNRLGFCIFSIKVQYNDVLEAVCYRIHYEFCILVCKN